MDQPPFRIYIDDAPEPDVLHRVRALKQAINLVGDRTTEEVLQAAHWIAEGEIIPTEGDNDEDNTD